MEKTDGTLVEARDDLHNEPEFNEILNTARQRREAFKSSFFS
jgi:hypothetical protein